MRILKAKEETQRGRPRSETKVTLSPKYLLYLNSKTAELFKNYIFIWTEGENEICISPEVPMYVRDNCYEVFERGICKSKGYHGGALIRFASVLNWLLPGIVKESRKLVNQEYLEEYNVFKLKF